MAEMKKGSQGLLQKFVNIYPGPIKSVYIIKLAIFGCIPRKRIEHSMEVSSC